MKKFLSKVTKILKKGIYDLSVAVITLSMVLSLVLINQVSTVSAVENNDTGNYLTFTAEEAQSGVSLSWDSGSNVQIKANSSSVKVGDSSVSTTDWQDYSKGTTIILTNKGDSVSFKGQNVITSCWNHFSMYGKIAGSGDVTSLTNGSGGDVALTDSCYSGMFYFCDCLTSAPSLPSTTLADSCYYYMFFNCAGLKAAPVLPASELKECCYRDMFCSCTSLIDAPALQATTLADYCYYEMFYGCTGLKAAPELPASELKEGCYLCMFQDCASLITVPKLQATTLANSCYSYMFGGCSKLIVSQTSSPTDATWSFPTTNVTDWNNGMIEGVNQEGLQTVEAEKSYQVVGLSTKYNESIDLSTSNFYKGNKVSDVTLSGYNEDFISIKDFTISEQDSNGNLTSLENNSVLETGKNYLLTICLEIDDGYAFKYEQVNDGNSITYKYDQNIFVDRNGITDKLVGTEYTSGALSTDGINENKSKYLLIKILLPVAYAKDIELTADLISGMTSDEVKNAIVVPSGEPLAIDKVTIYDSQLNKLEKIPTNDSYNLAVYVENTDSNYFPADYDEDEDSDIYIKNVKLNEIDSQSSQVFYAYNDDGEPISTYQHAEGENNKYIFAYFTGLTPNKQKHTCTGTGVKNATALKDTVTSLSSGSYYLYDDITVTSNITIPEGETVNICLNGHILNLNGHYISNSGNLSIYDCGTTEHVFKTGNCWTLYKNTKPDSTVSIDELTRDDAGTYSSEYVSVEGGCIIGGQADDCGDPETRTGSAINNTPTSTGFTLIKGNIIGNSGGNGAIYDKSNQVDLVTITIEDGIIAGNDLPYTGSRYYNGGVIGSSKVEILDSNGLYTGHKAIINGGKICFNNASQGVWGAVLIYGKLTMTGGQIKYNRTTGLSHSAGGLYVGTLEMTGGEISNNYTNNGDSGGVKLSGELNYGNTAYLGGTAIIKDNKIGTSVKNLLINTDSGYWDKAKLLTGDEAPKSGMNIGISMKTPGEFITSGADNTIATYFFSDNQNYKVNLTSGNKLSLALPYTLSFDMYGHGTQIDSQTVYGGSLADEPTSPKETGYTFIGWYKDEYLENEWDFETDTVSEDTTLYAKWERITYLNFTAEEDNSSVTFNWNSANYVQIKANSSGVKVGDSSVSTTNWQNYTAGTKITLTNKGDTVLFTGSCVTTEYYKHFTMTGKIAASGDVTSLTNGYGNDATLSNSCYQYMFRDCTSLTSAPSLPALELTPNCYYEMFYGCTNLTSAPELPALALENNCYYYMFSGCTSLTSAPELPATTLAEECYTGMFSNCTSLISVPEELPATTLATKCYSSMFKGCTSLTSAPSLPATTLATQCYYRMFRDCTSLTSVPEELPATTLARACYSGMFCGCTSLTNAPELPATTLSESCYYGMFDSCTNLTSAPSLPATTLSSACYAGMFYGCTGLTSAPKLKATTLASYCYYCMFQNCTSLKVSLTNDSNKATWVFPSTGESEWNTDMITGLNSDISLTSVAAGKSYIVSGILDTPSIDVDTENKTATINKNNAKALQKAYIYKLKDNVTVKDPSAYADYNTLIADGTNYKTFVPAEDGKKFTFVEAGTYIVRLKYTDNNDKTQYAGQVLTITEDELDEPQIGIDDGILDFTGNDDTIQKIYVGYLGTSDDDYTNKWSTYDFGNYTTFTGNCTGITAITTPSVAKNYKYICDKVGYYAVRIKYTTAADETRTVGYVYHIDDVSNNLPTPESPEGTGHALDLTNSDAIYELEKVYIGYAKDQGTDYAEKLAEQANQTYAYYIDHLDTTSVKKYSKCYTSGFDNPSYDLPYSGQYLVRIKYHLKSNPSVAKYVYKAIKVSDDAYPQSKVNVQVTGSTVKLSFEDEGYSVKKVEYTPINEDGTVKDGATTVTGSATTKLGKNIYKALVYDNYGNDYTVKVDVNIENNISDQYVTGLSNAIDKATAYNNSVVESGDYGIVIYAGMTASENDYAKKADKDTLTKAIETAQSVLSNYRNGYTQEEISTATNTLKNALTAFKGKVVNAGLINISENAITINANDNGVQYAYMVKGAYDDSTTMSLADGYSANKKSPTENAITYTDLDDGIYTVRTKITKDNETYYVYSYVAVGSDNDARIAAATTEMNSVIDLVTNKSTGKLRNALNYDDNNNATGLKDNMPKAATKLWQEVQTAETTKTSGTLDDIVLETVVLRDLNADTADGLGGEAGEEVERKLAFTTEDTDGVAPTKTYVNADVQSTQPISSIGTFTVANDGDTSVKIKLSVQNNLHYGIAYGEFDNYQDMSDSGITSFNGANEQTYTAKYNGVYTIRIKWTDGTYIYQTFEVTGIPEPLTLTANDNGTIDVSINEENAETLGTVNKISYIYGAVGSNENAAYFNEYEDGKGSPSFTLEGLGNGIHTFKITMTKDGTEYPTYQQVEVSGQETATVKMVENTVNNTTNYVFGLFANGLANVDSVVYVQKDAIAAGHDITYDYVKDLVSSKYTTMNQTISLTDLTNTPYVFVTSDNEVFTLTKDASGAYYVTYTVGNDTYKVSKDATTGFYKKTLYVDAG